MNGAQIVAEAREWVGTTYRHQGRLKQISVDCIGLVLGVGRNCNVMTWTEDSIRPWMGYARTPNPEKMRAGLAAHLDQATSPRLGDIAWIGWREHLPMHLAILAEMDGRETIIHAAGNIGHCVEHDLSGEWRAMILGWWRYRGRTD